MPWDEITPRTFAAMDKELAGISRRTMHDYYKLYEGYARKVNACRAILGGFDYAQLEGNQVYSPLRSVSVDYAFALLGAKSHELYFGHLGGDGGDPGHRFADVVEFGFPGGLENWHRAVRKAAAAAAAG